MNIVDNDLEFKDLRIGQLEDIVDIVEWYNSIADSTYATGMDYPIKRENLREKFVEVTICCSEFFVGIYITGKLIGLLKGSFKYGDLSSIWIGSLVIDPKYRNKGWGSKAINLFVGYAKGKKCYKNIYLSVSEENVCGRSFWSKNGFLEVKKLDKTDGLNRRKNVIVMVRAI
jgi:ribosomal protein S18 acetylase RimI-like enzyme